MNKKNLLIYLVVLIVFTITTYLIWYNRSFLANVVIQLWLIIGVTLVTMILTD